MPPLPVVDKGPFLGTARSAGIQGEETRVCWEAWGPRLRTGSLRRGCPLPEPGRAKAGLAGCRWNSGICQGLGGSVVLHSLFCFGSAACSACSPVLGGLQAPQVRPTVWEVLEVLQLGQAEPA